MLDDMEQSRSQHSIGIVENPLYAEDEAGPTYAGLAAKEKESEVCISIIHNHAYNEVWFILHCDAIHRLRWRLLQRKAKPSLSTSVLLALMTISNFALMHRRF